MSIRRDSAASRKELPRKVRDSVVLSNQMSREANAISAGPVTQLAAQRPQLFFARP
jgi:hypothetical protein